MTVGFAGQQEVALGSEDRVDDRLAGKQVIAGVNRFEMGVVGAESCQPALRGLAFTDLFFMPVLWMDELRCQRDDLGLTRGDHGGGKHLMMILGLPVGALAGRALFAMDLVRFEVFGAIEGNESSPIETTHFSQSAGLVNRVDDITEHGIEVGR